MDVRHHGCDGCVRGDSHCNGMELDRCGRACECPCGDEPSEAACAADALADGLRQLYRPALAAYQAACRKRARASRRSLVYRYRTAY